MSRNQTVFLERAARPAGAPPAGVRPHEGVRVFSDYAGLSELRERCDVLVVGSGPGGAVVAKELAEAGRDVVLLEEGPPIAPKDMRLEAAESLQRLLREGGSRATRGNLFMPTMQAIALGGGSLVNSAISCRAPGWALEKWERRTGVELSEADLAPHYERVEAFLGVAPTDEPIQGERNLLFKRGCDALGLSSEPTPRNVRGCKGSGECFTGCRNQAKQSTDVSYVPAALAAGARVLTSTRVEAVLTQGRRAVGVRGHVVEPFTGKVGAPFEVHADVVVLAAGCMQTPVILERSGLGGGWVGRDLQLHPGLAVMGVFPDEVAPWKGATQGYHSLHFLQSHGIKLEVLWSPPSVLAARLPGLGSDYQRTLLDYRRMAPFDVIVATERSTGRVRAKRSGFDPDIEFHFDQSDFDRLQEGVAILSDICWAAGAEAILPGLHGVPDVLSSKREAELLRKAKLAPRDSISAANHAMGTTRMSARAEDGVVDAWGRMHGVDGLYIADTGIFAGSPAVNPMLTVMALADRIALGLASS